MDLMPAPAADLAVEPVTDSPTSTRYRPVKTDAASALFAAAKLLLPDLERGNPIDRDRLRDAMQAAFGGSDADGVWSWKQAYDACEAAEVLFLRKFGKAMQARAGSPAACLAMLGRIAALLPSHTRRSEESQARQQFSTPLPLGFVASIAAGITSSDLVLEPSAGTGLLAIFAELQGATLALNELAPNRAGLLQRLFPDIAISRHDAAQIDDHLDAVVRPSVVLMNPPFSVGAKVGGRVADAAFRHVASALARLAYGGRLVAITGAGLSPDNPTWRERFIELQARGRVLFTAAIDGRVYARHGTHIAIRLTVIDRIPADDPAVFPPMFGTAPDCATLLDRILQIVPARAPISTLSLPTPPTKSPRCAASVRPVARSAPVIAPSGSSPTPDDDIELAYESCAPAAASDSTRLTEALYEGYGLQSIRIAGAKPHPTKLVQSAAMASVAPPRPSYRPHLPATVLRDGLLSDAQLESVIMAGEAHSQHLAGSWTVDETFDNVIAAPDDAVDAVRFRRGWFLGDGTGAGKGRQVAGVLLDNWLKGRRKALWVSKSDKLLEDAMRDWAALGRERLQITPLARFRQGAPIRLSEGILFTTYATLRSGEREGKVSRLQQILDWLGGEDGDAKSFDGVIVFDESHALANAAGEKGARGDKAPSQQGKAGLRLQHALPDARVLYVSATGATTVHNLAYAQRLGLWGGADFPFATRGEFVQAVEAGGVAAMEVLARDLKALGLYAARSLSYDGIEYQIVEHGLTPEQITIYDAYAAAFQVIHNNLTAALEASNVTGRSGTLNAQAKSAARSAFESAKQRFFNHLITAMKTPTLIAMIERDLADGHAAVIQLVSTGEALLERRLAEIPSEDWGDILVDTTPREAIGEYLLNSFPTQLHEPVSDEDGNITSVPVWRDGQPVQCREAVERRDRMIEQLASLAPVQAALDQIVQRFGADHVAEVTGRSRRIVRKVDANGEARLAVETRPASANLAETQAFMDDEKRLLVFSDAGGTGRSYHADLGCKNQRLRGALSARGRLEGGQRHPGPWPLEPDQPGAAAAVPAGDHRRQGGETLPVDHRKTARHPGGDHQGPAPDRRPGAVPRRRQSGERPCPHRPAPALSAAPCWQGRGLLTADVPGGDRPGDRL